jgi:hypothetical protein
MGKATTILVFIADEETGFRDKVTIPACLALSGYSGSQECQGRLP